jgi:hypothetical protein
MLKDPELNGSKPECRSLLSFPRLWFWFIADASKFTAYHIAPLEEYCHNSKNMTFQERGETTGRVDAIASKERHFSPLVTILEDRCVTLFQ